MNRRGFLLSTLAGGAASGCSPTPRANVASGGGRNGIVPLEVSGSRVRVQLGWLGKGPESVAFDTGTSGNAVDMDFFRTSGLKRTGDALVTDGGTGKPIEAFETTIPGATLGGYPVGDMLASVYDYKPRDEVGIVGPNVFWNQLVYLEFGLGRLRLRQRTPDAIPAETPYPYHDYGVPNSTPALTVGLPTGETVLGTLDSGANAELLLPLRFMKTLQLADEVRDGNQVTAGSESMIYRATVKGKVQVGPVTLESPRVIFFPGQYASAGMPIIARLRVLLDPEGHRWWALGPRKLPAAEAARLSGAYGSLRIEPEGDGLAARLNSHTRKLTWQGANMFLGDGGDRWTDMFGDARTVFDFHGPTAVEVIRTDGLIEMYRRSA